MRALILCLAVVAVALPAQAQTGAPSRDALALGGRAAHAAQPGLDDGVRGLIEQLASSYREGATRTGEIVDEKALAEVIKSETAEARPLLLDGIARIYAQTYSTDELKALLAYYRDHPGDPKNLPAPLAAKSGDLDQRQHDLVGEVGPRIMQDFFGDYCSRAKCSENTKRAAGLIR